jgi:hypothetical protein
VRFEVSAGAERLAEASSREHVDFELAAEVPEIGDLGGAAGRAGIGPVALGVRHVPLTA